MPRAVLGTIAIVAFFSILASVSLTGMMPYTDIDAADGFPVAFAARGWNWAAQFTAVTELICLPIVVPLTLLAQPRLTFAMASDGED